MRGRHWVPRRLPSMLRGDPLLPAHGAHHDRGEDKVMTDFLTHLSLHNDGKDLKLS